MWGAWKKLADVMDRLAGTLAELDRRVRASFALDEQPALAAPPAAGLPAAGANGAAAERPAAKPERGKRP